MLVILCALSACFNVSSPRITNYSVTITRLPPSQDGLKILQISDLHNASFGKNQEKLLALIEKTAADMIVITGDIIDKRNPNLLPIRQLLRGVKHRPVFFVNGNHEWSTSFPIRQLLQKEKITVLKNHSAIVYFNKSPLIIIGVDDPYTKRDDLKKAVSSIPNASSTPMILLAHAPSIFPAAKARKIDLTLCGHTHGGQIRLPFIGAIIAPGQGLLPRYDYGYFSENNCQMIINGGLGNSVLPIRIFNPPEIVLITLKTPACF